MHETDTHIARVAFWGIVRALKAGNSFLLLHSFPERTLWAVVWQRRNGQGMEYVHFV